MDKLTPQFGPEFLQSYADERVAELLVHASVLRIIVPVSILVVVLSVVSGLRKGSFEDWQGLVSALGFICFICSGIAWWTCLADIASFKAAPHFFAIYQIMQRLYN